MYFVPLYEALDAGDTSLGDLVMRHKSRPISRSTGSSSTSIRNFATHWLVQRDRERDIRGSRDRLRDSVSL